MIVPTIRNADPAQMPHAARLDEIAHLLIRAYLRARVRATSRPVRRVAPIVAKAAHLAAGAPIATTETALALCSEAEPPCPRRERRGSPTHISPTRDTPEDEL
jgi:hypothetical protein